MISVKITGLDRLTKQFGLFPTFLAKHINGALRKSVSMVEGEGKRRTPFKTGNLRASIGAVVGGGVNTKPGYLFVKKLTAGVGTNVVYAWKQHEGYYKHKVGERKYLEKGMKAAIPFIKGQMQQMVKNIANDIVK